MNGNEKAAQLRRHKALATSLFLLMLIVYALTIWLNKAYPASWVGYVSAFSEAAMVGALADWFAVTALFHHPLGIPIPHTNLIENSKKSIGDNLGAFVVNNFLTADNIRPYIYKLRISSYAAEWLRQEKNQKTLIKEITFLLGDIIDQLDDATVAKLLAKKGNELLEDIKLNVIVGNALHYFLDKREHEALVTLLAQKIGSYIAEHEDLVREKVKAESYFFIPKFVDNKLASKISSGLVSYFREIADDPSHRIRQEITAQLYSLAQSLKIEDRWTASFREMKQSLLSEEKMESYAMSAWLSLKDTLREELSQEGSSLLSYFSRTLDDFTDKLNSDAALQQRIDGWIHVNAYKYILRNTAQVALLISNTVGNWEGRELSSKLELEVGKDLQFIRINGTIVGGLVGLLIYVITVWLS